VPDNICWYCSNVIKQIPFPGGPCTGSNIIEDVCANEADIAALALSDTAEVIANEAVTSDPVVNGNTFLIY